MKYIAALLLAMALLAVPGLAFVPNIPVSDIDKITDNMVSESGSYSFTRVAVDANDLNTHLTSPAYTPQYVYSGMLFGADEANTALPSVDDDGKLVYPDSYTAGVLGNVIKTQAWSWKANPNFDPDEDVSEANPLQIFTEGVNTDTTRQYVNQGGSMYLTMSPIGSDAENEVGFNEMGFTKTNLAWMSSKMDLFSVDLASQGAIGGNFLAGVPNELSPVCQNVWLIERECNEDAEGNPILQGPVTVQAFGDADLKEAYAGSKSIASLKLYPADVDSAASAKASGYMERFAGYTDADLAGNSPSNAEDTTGLTWSDNEIVMDLGTGAVENFWITGTGVTFDAPECSDFPQEYESWGDITWPIANTYVPEPEPPV